MYERAIRCPDQTIGAVTEHVVPAAGNEEQIAFEIAGCSEQRAAFEKVTVQIARFT
jgi:hypothetical protein